MKMWKRCLTAILVFAIVWSSSGIAEAAGTCDEETQLFKVNTAELLTEFYNIEDKEANVILNGAINQGASYEMSMPYENSGDEASDLFTVDYRGRVIYAKEYTSNGHTWYPTTAVVRVGEEVQEEFALTSKPCTYNEITYYTSAAFSYEGNSYTVDVTYETTVDIPEEEQTRILQIPYIMATTSYTLIYGLKALNDEAVKLKEIAEHVPTLLGYVFDVEKTEMVQVEQEDGSFIEEEQTVIVQEPAFDSEADAEVIAALQTFYNECKDNDGLILYHLSEEYKDVYNKPLSYTFEKGAEVREQGKLAYDYMTVMYASKTLKKTISRLEDCDKELYNEFKNFRTLLKELLGTTRTKKPVGIIRDDASWPLLDETVRSSIFAENYKQEAFDALESRAYALRNAEPKMPAIEQTTFTLAEKTLSQDITFYKVDVTVKGEVTDPEAKEITMLNMEPRTTSMIFLEGTTDEEIKQAIFDTGIETAALDTWNALNGEYKIQPGNYTRSETDVTGGLYSHITDYEISYTPNLYKVKTNFDGNGTYPYGYQYELPVSEIDEIEYEYVVENDNGTQRTYIEGFILKVTGAMTISRIEGAGKTEHRLYDLLITDVQYDMGDAMKQILSHPAIESPTLDIKVPDDKIVGDVCYEDGIFWIEAKSYESGVLGMKWEPAIAVVMNENTKVLEATFQNGIASWDNPNFTHVSVIYKLYIDKLSTLGGKLDEADILYALNLPNDLVTDVVAQNKLLVGDEGVTAKKMHTKLGSMKDKLPLALMILSDGMITDEGQNGVIRLQGSENKMITGMNGEKLGYGGWDTTNNTMALYSYLDQCAKTNWSLAAYYKNKNYENISEQAALVASCMEAISNDPGFKPTLEEWGFESYANTIRNLIPELKALSENMKGPHEALKVEHPNFPELISLLLASEGQTTAVDTSNGVCAYKEVHKNSEKTASIKISVQAGNAPAETKTIYYTLTDAEAESKTHILSEEEAAAIQSAIDELEAKAGIIDEEKIFYNIDSTSVPQAGTSVSQKIEIRLCYEPKVYTVTIQGVPASEYEETFTYKDDYIIRLPQYSANPDAAYMYCYIVNGEEYNVENGSNFEMHVFTKDDLLTIFKDDHLWIERTQVQLKPELVPQVTVSPGVIAGYKVDFANKTVYLDANPAGLSTDQFHRLVNFIYEENEAAEKELHNNNSSTASYVSNGAVVKCKYKDGKGKECTETYTIYLMGDVNGNSKVDANDMYLIARNYLGTAAAQESISGKPEKSFAADMYGNSRYESNDAYKIMQKYMHWEDGTYQSVLGQ